MLFIQNSLFYKKYKKYILKGWLFGLKLIFGDFSKKKENKTFSKFFIISEVKHLIPESNSRFG
jgi:hypothetical protein